MSDPRDDFSVFEGNLHMFFGLKDPMGQFRECVEQALNQQVSGTEVLSVRATGKPLFLTAGVPRKEDPSKLLVTRFGSAVRMEITLRTPSEKTPEQLVGAVTMLFANVHLRGNEKFRYYFDVGNDVANAMNEDVFRDRFIAHGKEVATQ